MSGVDERVLTISGVKVVFPCKPYPSQFGMMDRVIKGLERKQNSLLESPTGSGKSLALLCSALAWQVAQHEKITRQDLTSSTGCCKPCSCGAADAQTAKEEHNLNSKHGGTEKVIKLSDDDTSFRDDDDDFKPSSKMGTPHVQQKAVKKRKHLGVKYDDDDDDDGCADKPPVKCICDTAQNETGKRQKVPKIYFGTRTHKQIAQIVRELKKTAYHDVRMVILASREYTCVHPEVIKRKNKSEGCRERLDVNGEGCKFNDMSKRVFLSQTKLQEELTSAWDLEDFVSSCKQKKACPYFVTRNLKEGADIVFCPYNYLIDPLVRKSMDISLKDQVVILDEAHNMEDSARDAASGSVTTEQINQAIQNLQQLMEMNIKFGEHLKLKNLLENLLNFIEGNNSNLDQSDYDTSYKVWSGFDIVVRLKSIDLGPDKIPEYQRCFDQVIAQNDDEQMSVRDRRNKLVKLSSPTQALLEQLFQILDYMYRHDLKFVEDYRVAIVKSMQYVQNRDTNDQWLGKNRRGGSRIAVYTLNFWCMNPAVAFSDFSCCRNVVLSSGTLSPMSSFASELGTPFPIQLEANHIIEDKQVWVGAIGTGPSGGQLQAVYRNMETLTFQDELGHLIYQVCTKVPHGVLCFLPSYRALQKFTDRWKLTGLWGKLTSRKRVMVEPRAIDRLDFDGMMKAFYEVVKGDLYSEHLDGGDCSEDDSEIDGALFFAVCRGKVSEGMDFADNNARAVITVKLKREYNDKHRVDRGLLSGSDWYEIQAFRALNQALGRCIRHRKDWGALIIVDDRFVKKADRYCKGLSRWVRSKVKTFETFSNFLGSMSKFTETMSVEMPYVEADTSFIPSTPVPGRRDSIYKPQSLDNSYMNTSDHSSPQFRSPPLSQSRYLSQTPVSAGREKNHVQGPAGVSSPTIQQQIMNVINSGTAPKDQPYYVIVNQGTPSEQTFLIEPNKQAGADPVQVQATQPVPQIQVGGQQVYLNLPGTMSQNPVAGTSLLQTGILLPQPPIQGAEVVGGDGRNLTHAILGCKPENAKKDEKNADIVFHIPNSTLPVEEQLRQFVSSDQAPKDQAYYVVVNKGENNERAFFIDPNKKGKSKSTKENKTDIDKSNGKEPESELKTKVPATEREVKPVKSEQEMKPVKSEQEVKPVTQEPDSSTEVDLEPQNKFLKFCQLPKTPASKVPVATVTPQRAVKSEQRSIGGISSTVHNIKHEPDHTAGGDQFDRAGNQASCTSPVLFEEQTVVNTHTEVSAGNVDNATDRLTDVSAKKKRIFKRNSLDTRLKQEAPNGKAGNAGDVVKEIDENTEDADLDFKVDNSERHSKCKTRGRTNRQTVDKVKQGRNIPQCGTVLQEAIGDNNVSDEKMQASGNEVQSDEEFLNTRRRGARKRKSTSKYQEWSKRSKQGVNYDDVEVTEKENKAERFLSCAKCGKAWMKTGNYERHKRHPEFLSGVFKKNTELLYFSCLKADDNPLQTVAKPINSQGVQLNSMYDDMAGCCIQFLQCKQCNMDTVIGARVLLADSTSKYKSGQSWILSSEVKQ